MSAYTLYYQALRLSVYTPIYCLHRQLVCVRPMELHEVFDASTQQLEEQLRVVRQALPHAQGSEHDR